MKKWIILIGYLVTSCNVTEVEKIITQEVVYGTFWVENDRVDKTTDVYLISTDKKMNDFTVDFDLMNPMGYPKQIFMGRFLVEEDEVVGVYILDINYEYYEYVYRKVEEIKVLENRGTLIYVDIEGQKTTLAVGNLLVNTFKEGTVWKVVIDRSGVIPIIRAVL